MIAQHSHIAPRGWSESSIAGVMCDGILARNSGDRVLPQAFCSSNGRPAARRKTRTVRLLTLGGSMWSSVVMGPRFVSVRGLGRLPAIELGSSLADRGIGGGV